jgi:hypothetical protein
MRYIYLGDRISEAYWSAAGMRSPWIGQPCDPVRDSRGKCIVGRGNALVVFPCGTRVVVVRRRLRLASKPAMVALPGGVKRAAGGKAARRLRFPVR